MECFPDGLCSRRAGGAVGVASAAEAVVVVEDQAQLVERCLKRLAVRFPQNMVGQGWGHVLRVRHRCHGFQREKLQADADKEKGCFQHLRWDSRVGDGLRSRVQAQPNFAVLFADTGGELCGQVLDR